WRHVTDRYPLSFPTRRSSDLVPILGVNMGTLGYLTEAEVQNLIPALVRLLAGEYSVENRMMLSGTLKDLRTDTALNDIVVTRSRSEEHTSELQSRCDLV